MRTNHAFTIGPRRAGLLLAALCLLTAEPAWALRCKGQLIDNQDTAGEILNACGEPDLRDEWFDYYGHLIQEQWYYNFGSRRLLHILTLRGGRLVRMDTDGYGFLDSSGNQSCRPNEIQTGMNKLRLQHLCGEPEQISVQTGYGYPWHYRKYQRPAATMRVKREEWHYNFGPRYLRRTVVLENGRVSYIQSEGYGD